MLNFFLQLFQNNPPKTTCFVKVSKKCNEEKGIENKNLKPHNSYLHHSTFIKNVDTCIIKDENEINMHV